MTRSDHGRRWGRIAAPLAVLRLSGQALEFVGWVLLARRLGAYDFGELSVAFLVARYAGLCADLGATFQGARDVAGSSSWRIDAYLHQRVRSSVVLALVFVVGCVAVGRAHLVPLAAVLVAIGSTRDWIAVGREQGMRAGVPLAFQGLALAVGSVAASTAAAGAVAVGTAYALAVVLSTLANPVGVVSSDDGSEIPRRWATAAVLANQVTSSADTMLLGSIRGASVAGVYAAIYRLPNAWLAVVSLLLTSLVPVVVRSRLEGAAGHAVLLRASLRTSAAGGLIVAATGPLLWFVQPALLGNAYDSGRTPLLILTLATAMITAAAPLHPFVLATGDDRSYARVLVGGAAVNVIANLVLIPIAGMLGAALATVLAQGLVSLQLWAIVRSRGDGLPAT